MGGLGEGIGCEVAFGVRVDVNKRAHALHSDRSDHQSIAQVPSN
jgi:hypothetical protein